MSQPVSKKSATLEKPQTFSEENKQFAYSLILIFLIPALLVAYTFWSIYKFQNALNKGLEQQSAQLKNVFSAELGRTLDDDHKTQANAELFAETVSQIKEISVLEPIDNGFQVIASSNLKNIGEVSSSLDYTTSWIDSKDMTGIIRDMQTDQRYYSLTSPLVNSSNEQAALINLQYSLAESDLEAEKNLSSALLVLAIMVFLVILLLFNHFRFFGYVILFKRLKEVDKMKDDFISMASHELKTPMAAIKGYMGMILEGVAGKVDQKAKDHLDKVLISVSRLDALVNALLDVSRLEQGRMQFDMQSIDLSQIIDEVVCELNDQAAQKGLSMEYSKFTGQIPLIFADKERLLQIFDNLIGNAIKYTFKGNIKIYHQIERGRLITVVSDSGVGIAKEDMKGLFGKLYRIRTEKTSDVTGTGLGLWISKELVLRMHGQIFAESRENVGSAFTVAFPIMKEEKKK